MFEHLFKGADRLAHGRELFLDHQLLGFERADALLIGANDRRAGGIDYAIQQSFDLLVELGQRSAQSLLHVHPVRKALIPRIAEHRADDAHEVRGGLHGGEQGFEVAFDLVPRNRLAVVIAALREAEIIGITPLASLGPCRREGLLAAGTEDRAAQGEVFGHVLA